MSPRARSFIGSSHGSRATRFLPSLLILLFLSLPHPLAGQATNLRLPSLPWGTAEDVVRERLEARGFHFAGESEDGTLLFDRADLLGHEAGIIVRTSRGRLVKAVVLMEPEDPAAREREFEALVQTLVRFYGVPTRRRGGPVAPEPRSATSAAIPAVDAASPRALWLRRDGAGRPYGARLALDGEGRFRLDLESAAWAEAATGRGLGAGSEHRMLVRSSDAAYRWAALEFTTRLLGGSRGPLRIRSRVTNVRGRRTVGLRVPACLPWIRIYREGHLVYDRGEEAGDCEGPEPLVDLAAGQSETHELSVAVSRLLPPDREQVTLEVFVFLPRARGPNQPARAASELRVGEVVLTRADAAM